MNIFAFGLGYTATAFARCMRAEGCNVSGTVRSVEKAAQLRMQGITAQAFDAAHDDPAALAPFLANAQAFIVSIPPGADGDRLPQRLAGSIMALSPALRWIGYLSSVGIYGDHGGAWIDETTPPKPGARRSRLRLDAEASWLDLGRQSGRPVVIFRLPGIYGPGRNALIHLRSGSAHRIVRPGQVFNRIHVEDIAAGLALSLSRSTASCTYNLADDQPSPPQDVVTYAASLLGLAPPPEIAFADAELSPLAASFYQENKRVSNIKIKQELGFAPQYPSYREGLAALFNQGEGQTQVP